MLIIPALNVELVLNESTKIEYRENLSFTLSEIPELCILVGETFILGVSFWGFVRSHSNSMLKSDIDLLLCHLSYYPSMHQTQ